MSVPFALFHCFDADEAIVQHFSWASATSVGANDGFDRRLRHCSLAQAHRPCKLWRLRPVETSRTVLKMEIGFFMR